jgi:hypothetical protein
LASGICAFSVSTLALKATIQKPHGYMAVSQDSKSLYISGLGAADGLFFVSDASTLEVKYQIPFPYRSLGPPAVSPVGHYAVIFTGPNQQSSVTAYTLDTSTNRIVSEFFANAPLGGGVAPGLEGIAFAPNGLSLWMLLGCNTFPTCGGFDPTGRVLAGVSFPSGQVIGTVSIPSDVASIAFPRIVPR